MIRMTSKCCIGFQDVKDLDEAILVALNWEYPEFTLNGVDYILIDGKYKS